MMTLRDVEEFEAQYPHLKVPYIPNIDSAILAAIEADMSNFDMYAWHDEDHPCGTTHCRGGWAIVLGGEEGHKLERRVYPEKAAEMIYLKSRPGMAFPDFYTDNETALADLRACAAAEQLNTGV